ELAAGADWRLVRGCGEAGRHVVAEASAWSAPCCASAVAVLAWPEAGVRCGSWRGGARSSAPVPAELGFA
ncbi:hypothetical protein ABT279_25365, partial [Amycolatopsis sp. NPDC000673]|uniref:hypothetical protein n=1 Tax=Amycolatopsis sp. NPDC000673 TaxID=3154267 RepID=UPI00332E1B7F